jgi:hypothetical protein
MVTTHFAFALIALRFSHSCAALFLESAALDYFCMKLFYLAFSLVQVGCIPGTSTEFRSQAGIIMETCK